MTRSRRILPLAVIVILLAAGGAADRIGRSTTTAAPSEVRNEVPVAAAKSAGSSAWFCAGATAVSGGPADGTVVVANTTSLRRRGALTVVPAGGSARSVPLDVGPFNRASVRLADVATGPMVSAVVELDGGGVVVTLATTGPLGDSATPCSSTASSSWYFAEGVTTKDAGFFLGVLNPFPDDAVVDFLFSTEEGQITPPKLTGVTVPGGTMLAINVGESVERRAAVSTIVRARTGRLAVGRLQAWDGTGGRRGVAVTMGAAAPGPVWYFPEGLVTDGLTERFSVFNPSATEAEVSLALALESGAAEPLSLRVPARSRLNVVANDETRIPRGVGHAVTIRTGNGVNVVAERTVDGVPPASRGGVTTTFGARLGARSWATASGGTDAFTDELIVVQNLTNRPQRVSVTALVDGQETPPPGLMGVELPAGGRRALRINDHLLRANTPLVIDATAEVIVEQDIHRRPAPGAPKGAQPTSTMAMAIPLR